LTTAFSSEHALGLDPWVDAGWREENASNKNPKFGSDLVRTEALAGVRERAGRGRLVNDRTRPRKG